MRALVDLMEGSIADPPLPAAELQVRCDAFHALHKQYVDGDEAAKFAAETEEMMMDVVGPMMDAAGGEPEDEEDEDERRSRRSRRTRRAPARRAPAARRTRSRPNVGDAQARRLRRSGRRTT